MTKRFPTNDEVHRWLDDTARGDMQAVEAFLDRGFDVDSSPNETCETALIVASGRGHEQIVDLLIARGAEVNLSDEHDASALHFAAFNNQAAIAQRLIDAGAKVDAVDDFGRSALHYSAKSRIRDDITRVLIQNGADPALRDHEGVTPWNSAKGRTTEDVMRAEVQARQLGETTPSILSRDPRSMLAGMNHDQAPVASKARTQSPQVQQRSRRL